MAVKVLELHHHGIRIGPTVPVVQQALAYYHGMLGLKDPFGNQIEMHQVGTCPCVATGQVGTCRCVATGQEQEPVAGMS
jgi:hypothetical protein